MREKQVLVIPKDNSYKPRNMSWSQAIEFFNISNEELERIIDNGEEIKDAYVDEAIIYDAKIS